MTRIIAGAAGSLRLATPSSGTRPTSDRVREAVFSGLEARADLSGTILDLYAGSGALGLEAASRGASTVLLVEKDSAAARVIATNIATLREALPHSQLVVSQDSVESFLAGPVTHAIDGVFIDPPYETDGVDAVLSALTPWLADGAWVVVERSTRSDAPHWPEGFEPWPNKTYGETAIYIADYAVKGSQPPSDS